jgi:hypothetical protein
VCKIYENKNTISQSVTRNKKTVFKCKMKPPADTDLNALENTKKNPFSGKLPDSYTRKTKTTVKFLFVQKIIKFCLTM